MAYSILDEFLNEDTLYSTELPNGQKAVWRLLSLKEWRRVRELFTLGLLDYYTLYFLVFRKCLVVPYTTFDAKVPAGIFISIGQYIFEQSGEMSIEEEKESIQLARDNYNQDSLIEVMKRIVYIGMPELGWEGVCNLNRNQLIDKFVVAEYILKHKHGTDILPLDKIVAQGETQTKGMAIDFDKENMMLSQEGFLPPDVSTPGELSVEELQRRKAISDKLERLGLRG